MILKCESCIESWIFPTFSDWLLFIPGPRPLKSNLYPFWTVAKIILCISDETGFLSDCPLLMLGIAIRCIQHSQAMLEHGVCELAHSFFQELLLPVFCGICTFHVNFVVFHSLSVTCHQMTFKFSPILIWKLFHCLFFLFCFFLGGGGFLRSV